jgi:hypothetical protein
MSMTIMYEDDVGPKTNSKSLSGKLNLFPHREAPRVRRFAPRKALKPESQFRF